ncbi:NACHT, LRR and PYD domains-containing protein 3-like [Alligator mississippiensis]|uniref:NACHT, LRR and PYD domains-containing protein 3-like n=1 Tax=Alligator mississippiensis TaxID=8496 RepID=A0A151NP08_ALLMI|nr:NACHT, LRR and PYD domains-containing protein 3-like [Alligator mississippiensis]
MGCMDRRCADLESSLKHLGKAELKEFKVKLNKYKPQGGFQPVLWSELESADALDIVRVLRSHFLEPYALQVAADIMALINKKDLDSTLRQAHEAPSQGAQRRALYLEVLASLVGRALA